MNNHRFHYIDFELVLKMPLIRRLVGRFQDNVIMLEMARALSDLTAFTHFQQMCNVLHLLNDVETGLCEMDWPNGAWTSPCLSRQLGNRLAQPQRTIQYVLIDQHHS